MSYVDGFVAAVPTENKAAYIEHCQLFATLVKKHGALSYYECWGEDVPDGQITSFPMAVKCKDDEQVVFSWIVWPSKTVREQSMEQVMAEFEGLELTMPFDGSRIIFGGFDVIVSA